MCNQKISKKLLFFRDRIESPWRPWLPNIMTWQSCVTVLDLVSITSFTQQQCLPVLRRNAGQFGFTYTCSEALARPASLLFLMTHVSCLIARPKIWCRSNLLCLCYQVVLHYKFYELLPLSIISFIQY